MTPLINLQRCAAAATVAGSYLIDYLLQAFFLTLWQAPCNPQITSPTPIGHTNVAIMDARYVRTHKC